MTRTEPNLKPLGLLAALIAASCADIPVSKMVPAGVSDKELAELHGLPRHDVELEIGQATLATPQGDVYRVTGDQLRVGLILYLPIPYKVSDSSLHCVLLRYDKDATLSSHEVVESDTDSLDPGENCYELLGLAEADSPRGLEAPVRSGVHFRDDVRRMFRRYHDFEDSVVAVEPISIRNDRYWLFPVPGSDYSEFYRVSFDEAGAVVAIDKTLDQNWHQSFVWFRGEPLMRVVNGRLAIIEMAEGEQQETEVPREDCTVVLYGEDRRFSNALYVQARFDTEDAGTDGSETWLMTPGDHTVWRTSSGRARILARFMNFSEDSPSAIHGLSFDCPVNDTVFVRILGDERGIGLSVVPPDVGQAALEENALHVVSTVCLDEAFPCWNQQLPQ